MPVATARGIGFTAVRLAATRRGRGVTGLLIRPSGADAR